MRQLNQTMAAAGSESHISFQMAYARSTQQRKNSSPMTKPAQYQNVRDGLAPETVEDEHHEQRHRPRRH